jgi:hypothetical protein
MCFLRISLFHLTGYCGYRLRETILLLNLLPKSCYLNGEVPVELRHHFPSAVVFKAHIPLLLLLNWGLISGQSLLL